MPNSMTGFAKAEGVCGRFRIVWHLRSVNHRFLDLSFRRPDNWPGRWQDLELQANKQLRSVLARGHLDCELQLVAECAQERKLELDNTLLGALLCLEEELCDRSGTKDRGRLSMDRLLTWPNLVRERQPTDDEQKILQATLALLEEATVSLVYCRATEGAALAKVISQLLDDFSELLERVTARLPALRHEQSRRLQERMTELTETAVEQEALARELAILLNRADISEELERLRMHLHELRLVLSGQESIGRRLDFFCQELNREANTLCAKSQDGTVTQAGVEMKLVVEKLREQAQNLE